MYSDEEFEKVFDKLLEQKEYDEASDALFSLARAAFKLGWQAAGGTLPPETDQDSDNIIKLRLP